MEPADWHLEDAYRVIGMTTGTTSCLIFPILSARLRIQFYETTSCRNNVLNN
jgi:hypothetical protein